MKRLLFAITTLFSVTLSAQSGDGLAKSSAHNLYGNLGFNRGGLTFGAAYEHMWDGAAGIGGHVRWFKKEDNPRSLSNGLFILGGSLGHHFYKKAWDLSFAPSFNIISIESAVPTGDDTTVFGPGLSISLLWSLTPKVAVGFDNARYYVWFDKDYSGMVIDDLSARIRISL